MVKRALWGVYSGGIGWERERGDATRGESDQMERRVPTLTLITRSTVVLSRTYGLGLASSRPEMRQAVIRDKVGYCPLSLFSCSSLEAI
jgi:hypothetical protein